MHPLTDQERAQLLALPHPERRAWYEMMADVERLPALKYEPSVPDYQRIDWSIDRADLSPHDADALLRDVELIRNLPEVKR